MTPREEVTATVRDLQLLLLEHSASWTPEAMVIRAREVLACPDEDPATKALQAAALLLTALEMSVVRNINKKKT